MNQPTEKQAYLRHCIALALAGTLASPLALAEEAAESQKQAEQDALDLERIVVTGSLRSTSRMESSASTSLIDSDDIEVAAPRSTAELFRTIPGIRSESSGGEGNANIAVRGLPVASGGAKFLVLQEDGLPVMQFGDIAFGNSDIFIRADASVETIEAIRGGTSSTSASNSPGGVINFISKTGETGGGTFSTSVGLDHEQYRTDFEFGGDLSSDMTFHLGGYYRHGEGPREAGYNANSGGQIKANITKEFDSGYVRLYFKHLDDKTIGYLPTPMYSDGSSISGFDAQSETIHSAYLQTTTRMNGEGAISRGDMRNGMNPVVNSIGAELSFDVGDDWQLLNRFRKSFVSGSFNSPFPSQVGTATELAESIGGDGATLEYANGPQMGQAYTDATGNGLAMSVVTFDVEMDNFDSFANDLQLSKEFDDFAVSGGLYVAEQNIGMSWMWNSYVMELKGDNAALLNVVGSDGTQYSDNGLYAYGVPAWGNCCQRVYDASYTIQAPYLNFSSNLTDDLLVDISVRHDSGEATGSYSSAVTSTVDMNGDGEISIPEHSVARADTANSSPINYDWSYTSYSVGGNYMLNQDLALFARLSHGGRANADRLLFGKVEADGSAAAEDVVDEVDQFEAGVKFKGKGYGLFVTGFYAETQEQNYEATSQKFFDREYEAIGIEVEAAANFDIYSLRGGITWTDAEISSDKLNPELVGNTPRRQADFIYSLSATANLDKATLGLSFIGTTDAYAQDSNDLKLDGYTQVNGFAEYYLTDQLTLGLSVNNLFDTVGITEAEESSVPDNNIIRARAINGRTSSLTLKYQF